MSPRWNRRETNIAQAGYFTILRSSGWFSALSRLPGGYRYVIKGAATPDVLLAKPAGAGAATEKRDGAVEAALRLQMLTPGAKGLGLLRRALIALVAAALTALFFLLLHLESPGH